MAQDEPTVSQIQAAIEADGLSWEAEENFLTQMTTEERRGYLGVIVTPDEMAALEAETRAFAAQERVSFGTGVGAPAAVDWRSGGFDAAKGRVRWSQKLRDDHRLMAAVENLLKRAGDGSHVPVKNARMGMPVVGVLAGAATNSFVLGDTVKQARYYGATVLLAEKHRLELPANLRRDLDTDETAEGHE